MISVVEFLKVKAAHNPAVPRVREACHNHFQAVYSGDPQEALIWEERIVAALSEIDGLPADVVAAVGRYREEIAKSREHFGSDSRLFRNEASAAFDDIWDGVRHDFNLSEIVDEIAS